MAGKVDDGESTLDALIKGKFVSQQKLHETEIVRTENGIDVT